MDRIQCNIDAGSQSKQWSIIGTNSLVTKDVPAYSIVGDSPAKLIRKYFSDKKISALQQLQWVEWSIEKVIKNLDLVLSTDSKEFKKLLSLID